MGLAGALDITPAQRGLLLSLLRQHLPGTEAWVYGSRLHGTARPSSDLDLMVFARPDQGIQVGNLREALEESDLPFRVDLLVWGDLPPAFQRNIEAAHVVLAGKD